MTKIQSFFLLCFGIVMLGVGLAPGGSEVDCGGRAMSSSDRCITTRIQGGSVSSSTRSYEEQRASNKGQKLFIALVGGLLLLGWAVHTFSGTGSPGQSAGRPIQNPVYARCRNCDTSNRVELADLQANRVACGRCKAPLRFGPGA